MPTATWEETHQYVGLWEIPSGEKPAITELSTLFWDAYLKDDQEAKAKLQSDEARELAGLMEEDVWEWK